MYVEGVQDFQCPWVDASSVTYLDGKSVSVDDGDVENTSSSKEKGCEEPGWSSSYY